MHLINFMSTRIKLDFAIHFPKASPPFSACGIIFFFIWENIPILTENQCGKLSHLDVDKGKALGCEKEVRSN